MVLDSKIEAARKALGIRDLQDWKQIRPEEIRAVEGCGPQTLDHIRLYLAGHGLTLRDDQTPGYWQRKQSAKIGARLSDQDTMATCEFTVVIDTREQLPFRFEGFLADADRGGMPLLIPTQTRSLGDGHGDYSILGMEEQVSIERKSPGDAISTFDAKGERLGQWLRTLDFLAGIRTKAVVIECTFGQMLTQIVARGNRPRKVIQKQLLSQVLAWQQDYLVPFIFADDRRMAEYFTYRILKRHYKHATKKPSSENHIRELINSI